ncbi:MAG TPA: TIGR03435 family protein [Bryobacteraceae bacterium]|jgi:uncharacterized protein (TIGR03435 family)|nr:TIGR03435 family protein [Bryobacteraceae bacterium]
MLAGVRLIVIASIGAALGVSQIGRREFDVASVKRSTDEIGGSILRTPGGLTATDTEFSRLLEMAFQTRLLDLSRVPDSLRSQHFDISAKAAGRISGDQYWEMLQKLLEDRFKVKYHRETKDAQLYALLPAKAGAAPGPKLVRSADPDCPMNPTSSSFCGVSAVPGSMVGQRVTMARISRELSPYAGRPVQDRTGLAGAFDFTLIWTPVQNSSSNGESKLLNGSPLDSSGSDFFSAVREQLGLKLESQRGQVEFLVIDHAENPTQN